jgi:asparagine synthase (glutamine-hydrolysing)
MSGIFGFLSFQHKEYASLELLQKMANVLIHRGPDECEYYSDRGLAMGFRGLLTDHFSVHQQPITNEDETLVLVCDGEIYNFQAIRENLKELHQFKSKDHREILLHLYEEENKLMLDKLNGIFAFAIWDRKNETLLCARDRAGLKPFFYAIFDGRLLFASELKAIVKNFSFPLDQKALAKYFAYGYVPAPHTLFTGIRQLLPAHYMLLDLSGSVQTRRYWKINFEHHKNIPAFNNEKDVCHNLFLLLQESVNGKLDRAIPPGIFLSGGIDSSSILALASHFYKGDRINTFSVKFAEATYDESEFVDIMARRYQTNHKEITITPKDGINAISEITKFLDEPCSDASIITRYLLSKCAKEFVSTILTGDGGDELFAGYPTFHAHRLLSAIRFIPAQYIKCFLKKIGELFPVSDTNFGVNYTVRRLVSGIGYEPEIMNQIWIRAFDLEEERSLFSDSMELELTHENVYEDLYHYLGESPQNGSTNIVEEMIDFYFNFNFPQDVAKIERASMANSLQVRCPFLDNDLMEYVFSLEPHFMVNGFKLKYILKKTMSRELPTPIIKRAKRGFTVPISNWIKTSFKDMLTDILSYEHLKSQSLLNPIFVERLLSEHLSGIRDNRREIWTLFMFVLWYEEYCR